MILWMLDSQEIEVCERNVRCGFRQHPSIAQPEATVRIAPPFVSYLRLHDERALSDEFAVLLSCPFRFFILNVNLEMFFPTNCHSTARSKAICLPLSLSVRNQKNN